MMMVMSEKEKKRIWTENDRREKNPGSEICAKTEKRLSEQFSHNNNNNKCSVIAISPSEHKVH